MNYKKAGVLLLICALFFLISYSALKKNNIYSPDESNSVSDFYIENGETNISEKDIISTEQQTNSYSEQQNYYSTTQNRIEYHFRNNKLLTSHYEKHGIEMGFSSKEAYEAAASAVITNPTAVSKPETDDNDGDTVYFIKSTGEIVFLSSDGYIRSYFIATEKYYNKQ